MKIGPSRWHLLAWTVLSATGVALFISSFEGWGDPIIDLGRDLYIPSQLLEGRVLYRDLLYNYGPVAPYLLAGVVSVFGDGLGVFAAFGIFFGLATLGASYAVGNRLGGVPIGFSAAFLFLLLSFFANSTWGCNFVLPYSFAATVGTAFSMWSFFFLQRYLDGERADVDPKGRKHNADPKGRKRSTDPKGRKRSTDPSNTDLAWSVALLFAAMFSKLEIGFGIAAVHALAWWSHKIPRKAILLTLGSGALLALLFVATFAARGPTEHTLFGENLAKFAGDGESAAFFEVVAGLDRPGPRLLRALISAGQLGLLMLLAGFGGLAPELAKQRRWVAAAVAAAALAAGARLLWQWAEVPIFQATPLVILAVVGVCLVRDRKDPLLLLGAFAFFTGLRVLLRFHPMWYGFYLVVPAYLFVVYGLGVRAAEKLPARRTVVLALAVLALLLTWRFESAMWRSYRDKTSVLLTEKGSMRDVPDGLPETVAEFLDYAKTRLAPHKPKMVVMPEGVSLNYFTGFANPTAYYLFTPPEIGSAEVERRMIRELEATRPELLLLTSRDLSEFGRRGIGLDYALELGEWMRGSYELERVFEVRSWRLVLLRRRDAERFPRREANQGS